MYNAGARNVNGELKLETRFENLQLAVALSPVQASSPANKRYTFLFQDIVAALAASPNLAQRQGTCHHRNRDGCPLGLLGP